MKNYMNDRVLPINKQKLINLNVTLLVIICFIRVFLLNFFSSDSFIVMALALFSTFLVLISFVCIRQFIKNSIKTLWIVLFAIFAVSYFLHGSGVEYFVNTITLFMLVPIIPFIKIKSKTGNIFLILYVIYCFLLILFAPRIDEPANGVIEVNTNGSSYAMFYLLCFMLILSTKVNNKIVPVGISIIAFVFQLIFGGRSALIGTILFIIYILFVKRLNITRRKICSIQFVLCLAGIVFAYVYSVILFEIIGHGQVLIFGKDIFTGRQSIWQEAFIRLSDSVLFGIGNTLNVANYVGVVNLHNQMMGYLVCFGVCFAFIIMWLISLSIGEIYKKGGTNCVVILLLVSTITSYFETNFYSSANMAFLVIAIVLISVIEKNKLYKERKNEYTLLLARKG